MGLLFNNNLLASNNINPFTNYILPDTIKVINR